MCRVMSPVVILGLMLVACAHDPGAEDAPAVVGMPLRPEVAVDGPRPQLRIEDEPAPPWGDLDWRAEGERIHCRLGGTDQETLEARGTFVAEMLLRRVRGLGELEIESTGSATERRLEIRGDDVARAAACRLLEGLKASHENLTMSFSLQSEAHAEPLVGPMSLGVLAGQRATVSVINEIAYIKDYELEVATASVVADPMVDVVQEGIVVDILPYADPDGRVQIDYVVTCSALVRPIREFTTDIGGTSPVTIQLPELRVATRRGRLVVPAEGTSFLIDGIEMPSGEGDVEPERDILRIEGSLTRGPREPSGREG
ncbi:MAG: hypothetical protein H6807_17815 [Planctomycetes bacterium]|nr:hypothetical protein [Planctomycetota bacterium]